MSSIRYLKCFEKLKYIIIHDGKNYFIIFLTLSSEMEHPVYGMHFFQIPNAIAEGKRLEEV